MEQQLLSLIARGGRLFYVFTGGLPYRYNHGRQFERTFPKLRRGENFALTWKPRWDHSFTSPAAQKELGQAIIRWYGEMRESAGRQQASA